jgi:hypothetical protein
LGMTGSPPEALRAKSWMYFPEADSPYYRVTVFSNYSPNNVPEPGAQWSLMAEVSESPAKPVEAATVVADTIRAMRDSGMIPEGVPIVSKWHRRLEYGYPTPWLGRDALLDEIEPALSKMGIQSRGRFGQWRYEVSNQDHSVMQGVWSVDEILTPGLT